RNCVIVYQKRDLPHAHCLMILADAEKPRSAADYELGWLVLAKIPDRANEQLYETISETISCVTDLYKYVHKGHDFVAVSSMVLSIGRNTAVP
ncbi:hypothetical protein, partial [Acinetobacter baumannii]|uniref:hypothetical protein n=1 Tax=Acinetobacter baumannii TaxID=470 RepID=UPI00197AA415